MKTSNPKKHNYRAPGQSGQRLLYDARGERVKNSPLSNKYLRTLLFWILPYFVINGIIFLLVCSSPRIEVTVGDTDDYVSADVTFTVKSLLPVKDLEVSLESSPVEFTKDGNTYTCTVNNNGTFQVRATAINGMVKTSFSDIGVLDDTAPSVDESSSSISHGLLTFTINDTQSGVDFDSIYGIINDDEEDIVYPEDIDRELGLITMRIPYDTESINLHFADMVGNARAGRITVTVSGVETDQEDDSEAYTETEAEETESGSED